MLKVTDEWLLDAEKAYPGIRGTIEFFEAMKLPPCPKCGSANSAEVNTRIVGRSMKIAVATTKMHLIPNGRPADFWCNACAHFFNATENA